MSQTVIGIFDNASEAQDAVEQLVKKGFSRSSIDVSAQNTSVNTLDTSATSSTSTTSSNYDDNSGESKVSKFFKSLFGSDDEDKSYTNYSKAAEKGTIVTVHATSRDEAEDAADILDDNGAVEVNDDSTEYSSASTGTTIGSAPTASSLNLDQTTTGTSIPVIEEQLQVGKRTVETGGVRLRSRIVERPVEESLRLREERVYVDRNPVNRLVTGNELESFKEGTIELTETAEVPVVAKEAYVVEEVTLGKDVNEREQTIRDTVRSTEVDVENIKTDSTTTGTSTKSSDSYKTNTNL